PLKATARFSVWDRGAPLSNALVSIDGISYGATFPDGTYEAVLPPGSHSYSISNPAFGTKRGSFTVTNGQTTVVEACRAGPP
ncbi:MAG TPA: carboxypeptidase regulatory-like domain-containing protein, partial [Gammaproteobacteria bacterium]|nr:carboxypeptidase regulatory-like domain-containing protein [Gammaproteobacteria bacterium]